MKSYKYAFLLWQFISLADRKQYDTITFDEVFKHADAGTIPSFLIDRFGSDLDLSIMEPSDWASLSEEWASFANAIDAERKFGVSNRGVCLLMAYAMQSLELKRREGEAS